MTTAIVHIIPEAMSGLAPAFGDDLEDLHQRSGIVVLVGVFGGFLLDVALGDGHSHSHPKLAAPVNVSVGDNGTRSDASLDNSPSGAGAPLVSGFHGKSTMPVQVEAPASNTTFLIE